MSISAYPLHWPEKLPRTERFASSRFNSSLSASLKNVRKSLELFAVDSGKAVTDIVLSSNVGGLDPSQPKDPGVAAWFTWDGEQRCIAVDRYRKVEDNLQAIHYIIEARRTEMRHGGLHIVRQTFRGFTALPAPKRWQEIFGFSPGAFISRADVNTAFRQLAAKHHPDKGGSAARMAELTAARDTALKEIPA